MRWLCHDDRGRSQALDGCGIALPLLPGRSGGLTSAWPRELAT